MKTLILKVILKEEDRRWSASIPTLSGCSSWGYSKQEALDNIKDAAEIYIIKSTLEALAGRLAIKYITEETIKTLAGLNDQMSKISKSKEKDYRTLLDLNADFHRIINESASNTKLLQHINLLRNQTLRYNYIYLSVLSHLDQSIDEHAQIIEALRKRDATAIELLMKNHGENAGKALCEYISKTTH